VDPYNEKKRRYMAGASQGGSLEPAVDPSNFEVLAYAYASDICTTNCFDMFACLPCTTCW